MVVTGVQIYNLAPSNFDSSFAEAIAMKFDLQDDPEEHNSPFPWIQEVDAFGLTAFEYSRESGPLGLNGPLGYAGPLGLGGSLPNRFHGHTPYVDNLTYKNNWCNTSDVPSCVYGPYGPLGESGPLNPLWYFITMYHLGEGVNFEQNYNINLDASGVWGVQGPLGPTGALGPLGPLGPLSISLQSGVTTTESGQYKYANHVIRSTSPIQYSADGTKTRVYDLFEVYDREFALSMKDNDCSFGVDSLYREPKAEGDVFTFTSKVSQFLVVNVVSVDPLSVYGLVILSSWEGTHFREIACSNSDWLNVQGGIQNFIVSRVRGGEVLRVNVTSVYSAATIPGGYYLYVTGSGLQEYVNGTLSAVDVWGPRAQSSGPRTFNILGEHQSWPRY
jgi:hypothetical protein